MCRPNRKPPFNIQGAARRKAATAEKYSLHRSPHEARGRTEDWDNKPDERRVLVKPNQYGITVLGKVRELWDTRAMFVFCRLWGQSTTTPHVWSKSSSELLFLIILPPNDYNPGRHGGGERRGGGFFTGHCALSHYKDLKTLWASCWRFASIAQYWGQTETRSSILQLD